METSFIIAMGITLVLSGFLKGFSGFGTSLILVGISLTFYEPRFIIPVLALLSLTLNTLLIIEHRKSIVKTKSNFAFRPETLVFLMIGTAIGTFSLAYFNPDTIKLLLGILTIIFITLYAKKIELKTKVKIPPFWKHAIIGNITGFFSGMLNINGPPVVIYNLYSNQKRRDFINSIVVFLTIADVFAITSFILKGLLTVESLKVFALFLPPIVVGLTLGRLVRLRVDDTKYRKYIIIILFGVGIKLIVEGCKCLF